jgi:hypothetical protein
VETSSNYPAEPRPPRRPAHRQGRISIVPSSWSWRLHEVTHFHTPLHPRFCAAMGHRTSRNHRGFYVGKLTMRGKVDSECPMRAARQTSCCLRSGCYQFMQAWLNGDGAELERIHDATFTCQLPFRSDGLLSLVISSRQVSSHSVLRTQDIDSTSRETGLTILATRQRSLRA